MCHPDILGPVRFNPHLVLDDKNKGPHAFVESVAIVLNLKIIALAVGWHSV